MYAPAVEQEKIYFRGYTRNCCISKDAENLGNYLVLIANPEEFFERFAKTVKSWGIK